jgi:hypothetical protein
VGEGRGVYLREDYWYKKKFKKVMVDMKQEKRSISIEKLPRRKANHDL